MSNKYAVLARTTKMQLTADEVVSEQGEDDSLKVQNYTVPAGTLIKVAAEQPSLETPADTAQVYVYDAVLREPNITRRYQCAVDCLLPVSDNLWPYIVSIAEPQRRLLLLLNKERCDWFSDAVPGEYVTVPGRCMEELDGDMRYDCVICYIGPVPEIHPVGYFFGLQLLNVTPSPQAAEVPFTRKYFECDPKNAIFTTADRIVETPPYDAVPPTAESVDEEQSENDWSISGFFSNAVNSIRGSLPL
ncbi:uncharacterized protein [Eurosta solidaginis]|uniref:uncharacterized protein n=1 Tax=Eurosta solidaginis TaxID=178769 RepID=UPI0035307AEF